MNAGQSGGIMGWCCDSPLYLTLVIFKAYDQRELEQVAGALSRAWKSFQNRGKAAG